MSPLQQLSLSILVHSCRARSALIPIETLSLPVQLKLGRELMTLLDLYHLLSFQHLQSGVRERGDKYLVNC